MNCYFFVQKSYESLPVLFRTKTLNLFFFRKHEVILNLILYFDFKVGVEYEDKDEE